MLFCEDIQEFWEHVTERISLIFKVIQSYVEPKTEGSRNNFLTLERQDLFLN